jgi:protocatechuate 3,4-dioxygenase beta subunit
MKRPTVITRRGILGSSGALATWMALGCAPASAAEKLRRTPAQVTGPFYPLAKPLDSDADLTLIKGHRKRAAGQVVHVTGRVLNAAGEPVAGARIDIWQANSHGRYTHPGDFSNAPLDPHFEGFATLTSDEQGRYGFKTIKPGAYPAGDAMRPPHIHFDVTGRKDRLTTQMYFPGEPHNDSDVVIATARRNRELLLAEVSAPAAGMAPDSWLARWDIVLETG